MTQPQPIQRQPSLPAFLSTSRDTTTPRTIQSPTRAVLDAITVLQVTSGLTLGLVLGQLAITIGLLMHQPAPLPQPTPPSLRRF